jgi:hypothetical protein
MFKIQNLTKFIFIVIVLMVLIYANIKNRTIQKIYGYTEVHISQIRVDQNKFFGKIFYPSELSQYRLEGDTFSLMSFNDTLRELISDRNLFTFFRANLIEALNEDKNIKLLKRIDVGKTTVLHIIGKDTEPFVLSIEKKFQKTIQDKLKSLVTNYDNEISVNDINVVQFTILDFRFKGALYLFSTILITILLYFAYSEVFKVFKNEKK